MIEMFKQEWKFYFSHLFDTQYKMGIKQYKDQKLFIGGLVFIPLILILIYISFFTDDILFTDKFYDLPFKVQDKLSAEQDLKMSLMFITVFFLMRLLMLPIDIKRANFKHVNWKIRIILLIVLFVLVTSWSIYRYFQTDPNFFSEVILGVVLSNFIFGNNGYETDEEKERYKENGKHV